MNIMVISDFFKRKKIVKTSELLSIGVTHYEIHQMLHNGTIERIKKGYYALTNQDMSELELVINQIPDGVICFDTALFYYGYSDRVPSEIHIAVNKNISKSKINFDYPAVKAYFTTPKLVTLGATKSKIDNTEVYIYTKDKLICDCLKYEHKMEIELFNKAIRSYIQDSQKNVSKLMKYAKIRGVEKKVYDKIGIWL